MSLIKESSIQKFFQAIKIHGESTVVDLLDNIKNKNSILKKYIIQIITIEYNISWNIVCNPNVNHVECKAAVTYFFKKYLSLKHQEIATELNIKSIQTVIGYLNRIKQLNSKIKQDRDFLNIIENIDNKIINFLNNGKDRKSENNQ